jgi:hypothetical protein
MGVALEPAGQIDGVRPGGRQLRSGLVERQRRLRERAFADRAVGGDVLDGGRRQRHAELDELDQVVVGARPVDDVREVVEGGHRVARQRSQLHEQLLQLGGDRLGVVDEGLEVVQGAAQVDERRVRQPHEPGQALQTLAERGALGGERLGGRRQVLDERAQIRALRGGVGDEVAGLDEEVGELAGVAVQLAKQSAGRRDRRVQVGERRPHRLALTLDLRGRALEDVLEPLACRPVQGIEDLVEVDL